MVMSAPACLMMFVVVMVVRAGDPRMTMVVIAIVAMAAVVTADRFLVLRVFRTGRFYMRMLVGMAAVVFVVAVRLTRMRR